MIEPKFPIDNLMRVAATRAGQQLCPDTVDSTTCADCQHGVHYTMTQLGREIGRNKSTPLTWQKRGGVPMSSADKAAVALGVHPAEVWDDWHEVTGAFVSNARAGRRALQAVES